MAFGHQPGKETIILSKGADWVCSLQDTGEVWPEGTECWVEIGDLDPIEATVTPETATASFKVESTVVDPVPNRAPFNLYLRFPTTPETTEYLWFWGQVNRVEAN